MTARELFFGYYPAPLNIAVDRLKIESLPNLDEIISSVNENNIIKNDWIYAKSFASFDGTASSRLLFLPETHRIVYCELYSDDCVFFHVWCLSFFLGMRLTAFGAGFLDATPMKIGKLIDFILLDDLSNAVGCVERFWRFHQTDPRKSQLLIAIIHTLFLGQNPMALQFERFSFLYTALDACFRLIALIEGGEFNRKNIPHGDRIKCMCNYYSIPVPGWASSLNKDTAEIVSLRNGMIHEGIFAGQPLGFSVLCAQKGQSSSLMIDIVALICRLIVALIVGKDNDYVSSSIETAQIFGLKIK